MVGLGGVTHSDVAVDRVVTAAAVSFAFDVAGLDEVGDDALGCSFGDSDGVGDVPEAGLGVARDAEEHLSMVGEEVPGPRGMGVRLT